MALTVLVVDDSPAMRSFVLRVIQLSGLGIERCLEASEGQQALDLLKQTRVDVILTDINMPGMDGEEFLERMQQDPALRPVPVIVISTDSTEHRRRKMFELGAKGYVRKPFLPEALREGIERVFRSGV